MNNNINYISKCLDLLYCLNKFISSNVKAGRKIYILHLDSTTTDRELFINKIYKNFRDRVLVNAKGKYNLEAGVGGIEIDSNGFWHMHLLVTFKKDYCTSTIYNHNTELRKLWLRLHKKYTGEELNRERYSCELVELEKVNRLTKYISKPVKHNKKYLGIPDYLPKGYSVKGSFRCTLGKASKLWTKKQMPSERLTDKQITNKLKSEWNEYYKIDYLPTLDLRKREFETLVRTGGNEPEKEKMKETQNKNTKLKNHLFNTFSCIACNGFSYEEIKDILLNEIVDMKVMGHTDNQIEEALDYANQKSIELLHIDILDNFGRKLVEELFECIAVDQYGNELPDEICLN